MKPAEALWLKHWTAKAVQCIFAIWHNADAASFSADTSASIAYALRTVITILREASRIGQVHPLCNLPRPVLCNIWSHLTLADSLAVSRTSRSLYCVVLFSPELWSNLFGPKNELKPLHHPHLAMYVRRSVAEPLHVGLLCTGDMFVQLAPGLAYIMPRITILHLDCCDLPDDCAPSGSLRGSRTWAWLLQVLTLPAPGLVSLQLRHVEGKLGIYNARSRDRISFDYPLFSSSAPNLRRCCLTAVLLPPPPLCGAFKDVTTFSYKMSGDILPSMITHVLETMPRLEVLQLEAVEIACEPQGVGEPGRPHIEPQHSSLRVLVCSFLFLEITEQLAPLLPLAQLQELWLAVYFASTLDDIEMLYPGTAGMHLFLNDLDAIACILHPGPDAKMPTVFFEIRRPHSHPELLAPFASITWLSVHEHLLSTDEAGDALPAAPVLRVLCVRLAVPSVLAGRERTWDCSGFLVVTDEQPQWALPALREVRIGATLGSRDSLTPVSIALHDVALWVHRALAFGDRMLDAVVLSSVWVADIDFCAAWAALREHTERILLEEEGDPRYFAADEDMSYYEHSASLFAE